MNQNRKSVYITGASRGLGYALTKQFIKQNWDVIALVRDKKDAARLNELNDGQCIPIISDVTHDYIHDIVISALQSHKKIDVLINNAGIGGRGYTLSDTTAEEVFALLDVHCLGVLRVTQAVLPFMKKDGMVINISSRFGSFSKVSSGELDDIKCSYSYRIAKAAQNMLTQCMCREFRDSQITICSIHPGRLKTDTSAPDAHRKPEEAAERLYNLMDEIEHGKFYSLFEGIIEW